MNLPDKPPTADNRIATAADKIAAAADTLGAAADKLAKAADKSGVPHSDALVLFGATGDLIYKKIFPALYAMERRGHLKVPVFGVARSDWTIEKFRARARASVEKQDDFDEAVFANFAERLHYISGDYGAPATHAALRKKLGDATHPLHYLGIPPSVFEKVIEGLGQSGCARGFRLSPDVTIAIGARVKRPGEELIGDLTELKVVSHPPGDEMGAYDRLLGDAMAGDGTLFAGQDGVDAAWAVVQPILGLVTPVNDYEPGTWGPPEAEKLTAGVCGCDSPVWLLPDGKDGESK
jgi:glucose-6-phosphate 1-dehydrogenase